MWLYVWLFVVIAALATQKDIHLIQLLSQLIVSSNEAMQPPRFPSLEQDFDAQSRSGLLSSAEHSQSRVQKARVLLRAMAAQCSDFASAYCDDMLKQLRKHLFDLADKADSSARAAHWMSAYNLLERQKEAFKRAHFAALRDILQDAIDAPLRTRLSDAASASGGSLNFSPDASLSLLDFSEMDRKVLLDRVSRPLNQQFDESLAPLTARCGIVFSIEEPEIGNNPFRPENFVRALMLGWDNARLDEHATDDLVLSITPQSFYPLNELYIQLNEIMIRAGVAPKLKLRIKKARDTGVEDFAPSTRSGGPLPSGSGGGGTGGGMPAPPHAPSPATIPTAAIRRSAIPGTPAHFRRRFCASAIPPNSFWANCPSCCAGPFSVPGQIPITCLSPAWVNCKSKHPEPTRPSWAS
jgi:Protein of unknown function (DUF1631)